ncbi:MAG TPA: acylphosphatase [Actinomycetota bacterium]
MSDQHARSDEDAHRAAKRVRVVVSGQVQGVFFRAGCAKAARARGVAGFVLNRPDGRVEAEFEGPPEDVDAMVEWCRHGTDWAEVESVDVTDLEPLGDTSFDVDR